VRHPAVGTVRYPAATRLSNRLSSKGSPVKVLSRFASPAGFALVLVLFFLVPFVSVSCEVPDYGEPGVKYTGSHLVSGTDPETPPELRDLSDELRAPADDPEAAAAETAIEVPDPGVQVLAIVLAVLAAAGVLTVLVPQLKARLFSAAALAAATLAMAVVTMAVAQSNLEAAVIDGVRQSGLADQDGLSRVESAADEMTHTEVGFWLLVVLLTLIGATTLTLGLFGDRLRTSRSNELPFGKGSTKPRS
jgi:hypothetical protein